MGIQFYCLLERRTLARAARLLAKSSALLLQMYICAKCSIQNLRDLRNSGAVIRAMTATMATKAKKA